MPFVPQCPKPVLTLEELKERLWKCECQLCEYKDKMEKLERVVELQSQSLSNLANTVRLGPAPSAPQLSSSGNNMSTKRNGCIEWIPVIQSPVSSVGAASPSFRIRRTGTYMSMG